MSKKNRDQNAYLILGAGRQGTAAAYDLARFASAGEIQFLDRLESAAKGSAERINRLIGREVARGAQADVSATKEIQKYMETADAVLSAIPYHWNYELTRAAIGAGAHFCDMGGHTETVRKQLSLDEDARRAGVSVVPDCGMGPGLINTMAAFATTLFDATEDVIIYDAGLPQKMDPPWYYQSTFNLNGLTNEMDGKSVVLRDGRVQWIDTLSEPELIEVPGVGTLEADLISGGASTAPWSFEGRLQRYENKTLRHPKHWEWMRAFKALGLFSEQPLKIDGSEVIPRQVFHTLLGEKINAESIKDMAIIRIKAVGEKAGTRKTLWIDLLDYFDETTGFTAMERLTGWHCAIMMGFQTGGTIPPGTYPVENAVDPALFMEAVRLRGIDFSVTEE